ncbi:MAG: hypothetical protein GEU99_04160 [Luteitalea sp.]|nr:hypothetical protein [Luteitalea sp.]
MTRKALLPLVATATLSGSAGLAVGLGGPGRNASAETMPDLTQLTAMTARFAAVDLAVDLSGLPPTERRTLAHLVEAARVMDGIFLRQVSAANDAWLVQLAGDRSALGRARLRYFLINKGPWSRLDQNEPFLPGAGAKPEGANFYPADTARDDIERWIESLPTSERRAATGFFTTIRRAPDGAFQLVPYSVEYQGELYAAAAHLRKAAVSTTQPSLKRYLETRAQAFGTNDYYESDVAWMEIDASIEPVIGPYEVYEDEWFNYKAAFEAFVTVRDEAESKKLAALGHRLQSLEDRLPIDPQYRNPTLGALAPIRVVDVIFTAGDANRGVQTAAFNLPNDERVIREKGSKRVMLKNVQHAKFTKVLEPIANVLLAAADQPRVTFDAFFTHILMHELMHGLGPHDVTVDGRETTVRQELKELYSTIEEAKADVSGLWALQTLIDDNELPRELAHTMYTTYLASMFRSIRFGINEAHGRGVAIQLNRFLDAGAVTFSADGTCAIDDIKIKDVVRALTRDIITMQAEGSYDKAKALAEQYGVVRPEVQKALDTLADVPVDIEPRFVTAERLVTNDE